MESERPFRIIDLCLRRSFRDHSWSYLNKMLSHEHANDYSSLCKWDYLVVGLTDRQYLVSMGTISSQRDRSPSGRDALSSCYWADPEWSRLKLLFKEWRSEAMITYLIMSSSCMASVNRIPLLVYMPVTFCKPVPVFVHGYRYFKDAWRIWF